MATKRMSIERILCPTDFSEFSDRALRRAVELGRFFGARLTVIHVLPLSSPTLMLAGTAGGGYVGIPQEVLESERREAHKALRRCLEPYLDTGLVIDMKILEGDPSVVIEDVADALVADLVVMGTHGRSGFDHLLLGSTAERVVRRTTCPVLVVGRSDAPARPLFQRILCATDLTPASRRTVDVALSLAQENQARLALLHVVEGDAAAGRFHRPTEDVFEKSLHQLRAFGEPAEGFCEVEAHVGAGTPWREILRLAGEIRPDLIVVGAHVDGGLGRTFLGSTANQVLRHAECPVLVTREIARQGERFEARTKTSSRKGVPACFAAR